MLNNLEYIWCILTVAVLLYLIITPNNIVVIYPAILLNITTYVLVTMTFQYTMSSFSLLVLLLIFGCLDLLIFYKYVFNKFSLKSIKF